LPEDLLLDARKGFSWLSLVQSLEHDLKDPDMKQERGKQSTIFHNTINRLSSTTDDSTGGPFAELAFWEPDRAVKCSWFDCSDDILSFPELEQIAVYLSETGFGKNKSTGRGRMDVSVEAYSWLDNPGDNDAWMLLSNAVPAPGDSINCHYSGMAKFPRMGGAFAQSSSPFKKPLYMFIPGTVFMGSSKPRGMLMKGIHPDLQEIVQNLYAYSIPVWFKEE
jgi:CRISPR-associated protein Csm4